MDVAGGGRCRIAQRIFHVASPTCAPARRLQSAPPTMRLLVICALAWLVPGCFYLGSINQRPRAVIEKLTPGPYHYPGDVLEFSARKSSDDDGRALRYDWRSYACTTDTECEPIGDGASGVSADFIYQVRIPDHVTVVVQLDVHDDKQARGRDIFEVEAGNRAAELELQVLQGAQAPGLTEEFVAEVPIELAVKVAGATPEAPFVDADGDSVEIAWQLFRPSGSNPDAVEWAPVEGQPGVYRLVPDVAGVWEVQVTGNDGIDDSSLAVPVVVAADGPPCIAATSPAARPDEPLFVLRADGPRQLSVTRVTDQLDPHPRPVLESPYLGSAGLGWRIADPTTEDVLLPVAGAESAELTFDPARYQVGDVVVVSVDASDRVERAPTCDDQDRFCSQQNDGCQQRVSWEVHIR